MLYEVITREAYSKTLMDEVAKKGTIHKLEHVPEVLRRIFVTAHDVTPRNNFV